METVKRFLADEGGPTATEYAVMLALIIAAAIVFVTQLGINASNTFNFVGSNLTGS